MSTETDLQFVERRMEDIRVQHVTEMELASLKQWKASVDAELNETKAAIQSLQDERTKALKWGITALGGAVLAMGSWMWTYISSHLK